MFGKNNNGETANEIDDVENVSGAEMSFEEQEFKNYCEANDFDCNEEGMDEDTRRDFIKFKKRFTRAVAEKRIVIDGDRMEYTVSEKSKEMAGQKLNICPPNGRALLAMDGYKDNQQQNKLLAYIAALCKIPRNEINKISSLDRRDYQFLTGVATLFLTE